jgi:glycosyltransferase involved in cell wall biosynthesis
MGAFPIQTNTACCDEWLEDGISGFIISHDDLEEMSARIRIALRDDVLVDQASKINWAIAERRLDLSKNRKRIINFYSKILNAV